MRKIAPIILSFAALMAFLPYEKDYVINRDTSLITILEQLGVSYSEKKPNLNIEGVSALVGEDIVKYGYSKRKGEKKSRKQSKHFECLACHNIKREDPNLAFLTPEARLTYTAERGMPFLQGTTLYGSVNRDTYYNGDYEKKYGELVQPARKNIREAIQLCATECAQGRRLKDWELESVLAYLWTIDLKVGDLNISDTEIDVIEDAINQKEEIESSVGLLQKKYSKASEATFIKPPDDRSKGVGLVGNPNMGKLLYKNSCLHCHYQKKYSFLHLDEGQMSLDYLNKKADTYHGHSIYQVARYGTYSKYGKQSYMPRYTEERMSQQQLADLRAYISKESE